MNSPFRLFLAPLFTLALVAWPARAEESTAPIDAEVAIRMALANSPALGRARIEREAATWGVAGEESRYQYVFGSDAGYTQAGTPRLQASDVVSSNTSRSLVLGAGLNRTFAGGTAASVRLQGERFENEFSGGFVNPILNQANGFGAVMRLTLSQPLLRGSGVRVGQADLRAARTTEVFAAKTERRVASQLVRDVLLAYHELWYASQAVRIEEHSLKLAQARETEALEQVQRGALAPADAFPFSSRVAELEEAKLGAETTERARGLELARLTGGGRDGEAQHWVASTPPAPGAAPSKGEVDAALRADSVELAELEAQVETARVRASVAGEPLRPRLDLEGYVESRGLGENPASAVARAGQLGWVTGHVGVALELPIGDRKKMADRAAAQLAIHSANADLRAARERISSEAQTSVMTAHAAAERLKLAAKTRMICEQSFEAEQKRFQLGISLPLQLRLADDEVRRARLRELRATVDLSNEQAQLQHLTGKLASRFRL